MGITLWRGGKSYWYSERGNTIVFASKLDAVEFAELDLKTNILYIRTDYKDKFLKAKADIIKEYNVKETSEYTYMK